MSADFTARALAVQETARARRLRILRLLAASIERVGGRYPADDAAPPTIGADTASITMPSPKVWSALSTPLTGSYWSLRSDRFTLYGGVYRGGNQYVSPDANTLFYTSVTQGDGSNPAANIAPLPGGKMRFMTDAPKFELSVYLGQNAQPQQLEMRVDGLRVPTQFGRAASSANDFAFRYIPVTFGDGSETHRRLRRIEILCIGYGAAHPGAVITDQRSFVGPWAQPDALKVGVVGDSFTEGVYGFGVGGGLGDLIGQADTWNSGLGATGWFADAGGARSSMDERWPYDVTARGFDVVFDLNGINDGGQTASAAAYRDKMLPHYTATLAAKPETIVVLTGPMSTGSAGNVNAGQLLVRAGKKLLAAAFPKNAIFLDNLGDAAMPLAQEPWVTGNGRVGATANDGNADLVTGADGTHPSPYGNLYLAQRIAAETARAIPALIAAQ
ncbi:MAG: GDSL-type esterase/lipase family protein [Novosphingobium sp.]